MFPHYQVTFSVQQKQNHESVTMLFIQNLNIHKDLFHVEY